MEEVREGPQGQFSEGSEKVREGQRRLEKVGGG